MRKLILLLALVVACGGGGASPDRIVLTLSRETMKADGSVTAKVQVFDTDGKPTHMIVAPAVTAGPTGPGALTVSGMGTSDDPFELTGTLAGEYTVTASLGSNQESDFKTLVVVPGAVTIPPELHVRLATAPDGADVTNITAGTELVYRYSVVDDFGNPVVQPNVIVSTKMLGAVIGPIDTEATDPQRNSIYQGPILNFVRSGTFAVSAHLVGTTLTQTKMITVGTDQAGLVAHLTLSNTITQVGNPISYTVAVLDQFGNPDTTALAGLSLTFVPVTNPPNPACSPNPCTSAARSGTINFPQAGSFQVTTSFTGVSVISDSLFVSVINAPVPPTLTIFNPTPTDVFAPGDTVLIRIQTHTASAGGGTVAFIASGLFGDSGVATIGQDVCPGGIVGCAPVFSITIPGGTGFGLESLLVMVSDGSSGAAITKSVTFTIDPARQIRANGGRIVTVIARGGRLNAPMGLTTFGTDLYVANNGNNELLKIDLAATPPVIPGVGNIFSAGTTSAADVQLRPAAGALGVYPPAAFQGLYVGNDGGGGSPFRITSATGTPTTFGPFPFLPTSAYQATPVPAGGGNTSRLFAADFANNRIRILDPVTGADLVPGGGGLAFALTNPWGVTFFTSGTTPSTKVVASNDGSDDILVCNLGTGTPSTWVASCAATQSFIADTGVNATVRQPRAVAIGPTSGKLYVTSFAGPNQVLMYDQTSPLCASNGTCPESVIVTGLVAPNGLAFDAAGNMYVSDEGQDLIIKVAPNGNPF